MRINAARKSILADNSEQFRTIQREKNPTSRKQVPRSKKPPTKNVESFETELLDEIVKFSEKETLSLEACQHIATKPGIHGPLSPRTDRSDFVRKFPRTDPWIPELSFKRRTISK